MAMIQTQPSPNRPRNFGKIRPEQPNPGNVFGIVFLPSLLTCVFNIVFSISKKTEIANMHFILLHAFDEIFPT